MKCAIAVGLAWSVASAYAVSYNIREDVSAFTWLKNNLSAYSGGQGPSLPPNPVTPPQGPVNQDRFSGGRRGGFDGGHNDGFASGGGHEGGHNGGSAGGHGVPDSGNPLILLGSAISGLALLLNRK